MAHWRPGERAKGDGIRPPLPSLPQFPAMRGYAELDSTIRALGFRHAADVLRPSTPTGADPAGRARAGIDDGFRVLDGLWFPGRGGLWQRVDLAFVRTVRERWRASSDSRADAVATVVDTLEDVLRDDPMGLRRIVLWQLGCLLKDSGGGPSASAAEACGVHGSEAELLAAAVALDFPGPGAARRAAETFSEVWPSGRLRQAVVLAAGLPAAPTDHLLARLLAELRARSESVARLTGEATRLELRGDLRASAAAWLGAARQATDDPHAEAALLRVAALIADEPDCADGPAVRAAVDGRTVRLSWRPPRGEPAPRRGGTVSYRVLRFPEGMPQAAVEVQSAGQVHDAPHCALDEGAPVGRPLRYAVFPMRRDRIAGVPHATPPVLLVPDVREVRVAPVPEGVRLRWRCDPAAAEVRVVRTACGEGRPGVPVPCDRFGLVDRPLLPGTYRYEISCGYPGQHGRLTWSPGVPVTAQAQEWPLPVEELTVRPLGDGGRVSIAWRPPARGHGELVPWPTGPVGPGEDVSEMYARLSRVEAGSAGPDTTAVELAPPPRGRVRMTAVSVLGDRAVSGPSVVLEHPGVVENLAVRRLRSDIAEVRFGWPEPAVLVLVAWEHAGGREERRIPRSRYRTDQGIAIPVTRHECEVTVTPLPRPDAVVVAAGSARAILPAEPTPAPPAPDVPAWAPTWLRLPGPWWARWRRWWHRSRR